jgi:hypothetical protein
MAMLAHLRLRDGRVDRRSADRRMLKLRVPSSAPLGTEVVVLIHDLSLTGLLIETPADLAIGADFEIELPEAGPRKARVIWNNGRHFGCEFDRPISRGGLSAALLRNPISPEFESVEGSYARSEEVEAESGKLPLRTRFWILIGLIVASWAIVIGVFALIF